MGRVEDFDEIFVGWGHEDADFFLRLHNAGVRRKNGFCATEVFHFWHKEAARLNAAHNASMVEARCVANKSSNARNQATTGGRFGMQHKAGIMWQ
ncbi:MAG: hypothetical protein K9K38_02045 [Rhodoferax sp.]|nr:hypothetical protein [Rhodoferax sp.]